MGSLFRSWLLKRDMLVIMVLSLVTFVESGRQICRENCRIIPSAQVEISVAKSCKCFGKHTEGANIYPQKRLYEENNIHYDSAKNIKLRNYRLRSTLQYIPFVSKTAPKDIVSNWVYKMQKFREPKNISLKTKRENINFDYRNKNLSTGNSPIYLDINIHEKNNKDMSLYKIYENKMKELSEIYLKDCLDLHVIIYSRNQGKNIETNDILSERNKIYNILPESELLIETDKKCNQSATIVSESFNEIRTKTMYTQQSDTNNERTFDHTKIDQDSFRPKILSLDTGLLHMLNPKHIEKNTADKSSPLLDQHLFKTKELGNENSTELNYTFQDLSLDDLSSTLKNTQHEFSTDNIGIYNLSVSIKTTPDYEIESTTKNGNFIIDHIVTTSINSNNVTEMKAIDDMISLSDFVTSEKIEQIDNENITQIPEQEPRNSIGVDTSNGSENKDNFINSYIFNPVNITNRTKYFEGEYEIPKVITVELSNETIISTIQGNEAIPNLDFVTSLVDKDSPESAAADQNLDDSIPGKKKWNTSKDPDYINNITNDTSFELNGKFYFKYGLEYVPASFVQEPDGQVNVALDLLMICKSNITEMSKIIQTICKCINLP